MQSVMPAEMTGLAALVFALGLRHGFDPDHLVAIDGLTRASKSRWCGLFFSLGHGLAVTLVGLTVALAAAQWQAPAWLGLTGATLSIGVLLALGCVNVLALLRTPADARVPLVGLRGLWLAPRLARVNHPALMASVGAAFALSFDTISHALLFSLHGWTFAVALGGVFTLGMALTDALNGWLVAKMMIASRWMSAAIAFLCLLVAALGFAKHLLPALDERAADFAPVLSLATLGVIAAVFAAAVLRSRSAYREAGS